MPEIKGFCGWRYNPLEIRDLSSVLAPPYDVISQIEQNILYRKDPRNVIRLILGKESKTDAAGDNKYTRARVFLKQWMSQGILIQDQSPAIYVYVQDYREEGKLKTRIGFIAAMKLDESLVLRHENTLAAPKKDRLALLKQVRTNLSPIFGLFEDKSGRVQKLLKSIVHECSQNGFTFGPCLDVTMDGVQHRLFVEDQPEKVAAICSYLRDKPMLIADGHHRLEVAFQYKKWIADRGSRIADKEGEEAPWNYVMVYFSDCDHNPFKIYPTHRLIQTPKETKHALDLFKKRGSLKKVSTLSAILSKLSKPRIELKNPKYTFGVFTKKDGFCLFELHGHFLSFRKNNPADRLDVAVLHKSVVEPLFQINLIEQSHRIDFTRRAEEAVDKVKSGQWDIALFLRPTSLKEMIVVSKKGLKMPQKSTYFYPKLLSGLVFHQLEERALV